MNICETTYIYLKHNHKLLNLSHIEKVTGFNGAIRKAINRNQQTPPKGLEQIHTFLQYQLGVDTKREVLENPVKYADLIGEMTQHAKQKKKAREKTKKA